jgi:hypothetical protein
MCGTLAEDRHPVAMTRNCAEASAPSLARTVQRAAVSS